MRLQDSILVMDSAEPTEAYTEEEIHRALGRVRIETCSNDMELVERMYDVVNKAQYAVPQ